MREASESPLHILTVGHSNMALREFVELVAGQGIDVLVDTRSNPYSRWVPHFSRESLRDAARGAPVEYRYMGDSLGGKPSDRKFYGPDGSVDYAAIAQESFYVAGLERLLELARQRVVCLLCTEEDPIQCHRRLLVGKSLTEQGVTLRHLRKRGVFEDEESVQRRYLRKHPQQIQGALALT